ncbi:hypothetical protein [Pedobacter sp. L105]|uniref:hypothetical protein n=1 Tax=Pedobacter sp. L105 TaxID=1641871 RepID=UPI00131C1C49|nr:hypothetical protein [Pedobacter sp. L105]
MIREISELKNVASSAILRLRGRTLKSGQPFMINTNDLPKNQCYLEFPDRKIQLVRAVWFGNNQGNGIYSIAIFPTENIDYQVG